MKKSNSLDKVEKTVLVIAVLLIPITIGLGVFKNSTQEKKPYVSVRKEETKASKEIKDGVALISKEYTIKRNGNLSLDAEEYFEGSSEDLKKMELDFEKVDLSKVGSYPVTAELGNKAFHFTVKVEESENPTIKADKTSFKYLVGAYSTMDEVKEIANVSATDANGNDITEDIVGWTDTLPVEEGKKDYRLSVTDSSGNTGYLIVTIDFQRVRN